MDFCELNCTSSNCVICGSGKLKKFRAFASDSEVETEIFINECRDCGFAWQYPRGRSVGESNGYFTDAYRFSSSASSANYFVPELRNATALLQIKLLENLTKGGTGKLLDIGAGAGYFARQAASNGWDVTVCDPAINKYAGFPDNIKLLENGTGEVPSESFDVITMWDVIEHVESPMAMLYEAGRLLKRGGLLLIETGNYMCAERVSQGVRHWIYQLDHRWYFSPESLTQILSTVGLAEISCHKEVLRPHWIGEPDYPGPSRMMFLKEFIRNPIMISKFYNQYLGLYEARQWDNAGLNIFTLYARK